MKNKFYLAPITVCLGVLLIASSVMVFAETDETVEKEGKENRPRIEKKIGEEREDGEERERPEKDEEALKNEKELKKLKEKNMKDENDSESFLRSLLRQRQKEVTEVIEGEDAIDATEKDALEVEKTKSFSYKTPVTIEKFLIRNEERRAQIDEKLTGLVEKGTITEAAKVATLNMFNAKYKETLQEMADILFLTAEERRAYEVAKQENIDLNGETYFFEELVSGGIVTEEEAVTIRKIFVLASKKNVNEKENVANEDGEKRENENKEELKGKKEDARRRVEEAKDAVSRLKEELEIAEEEAEEATEEAEAIEDDADENDIADNEDDEAGNEEDEADDEE